MFAQNVVTAGPYATVQNWAFSLYQNRNVPFLRSAIYKRTLLFTDAQR